MTDKFDHDIFIKGTTGIQASKIKDNRSMDQSNIQQQQQKSNKKQNQKRSINQTSIQNYKVYKEHEKQLGQTIDPRGIIANGIYAAFSGIIESLHLFSNRDQDLQLTYYIKLASQWHDETPETMDSSGVSTYCSAKDGKITFSLEFDTLVSCMYVESWPQLIMTFKGFDAFGNEKDRAYAQILLPAESGIHVKEAAVFEIVRNVRWYHKWLPFCEPTYITYDQKQMQRVIERGEGRQSEKIRCIGKIRVRTQVLLRNQKRFGYQ